MYLRAKYTKYKMAKTKFSIWRYIICEICKKNGSNRPFLASRVADTIFPPPIEGHHRQLDNQCKDPMDNNKDCRVGQLTSKLPTNHQTITKSVLVLKQLKQSRVTPPPWGETFSCSASTLSSSPVLVLAINYVSPQLDCLLNPQSLTDLIRKGIHRMICFAKPFFQTPKLG